jgi:NTE family protein
VVFPHFYDGATEDVLIVQINPITRQRTPRSNREIMGRVNEITFNASLYSELRSMDSRRRGLFGDRAVRLHRIAADGELRKLSSSSKFAVDWPFFQHLRDVGREAADEFLREEFAAIGRRGTLDLRKELA